MSCRLFLAKNRKRTAINSAGAKSQSNTSSRCITCRRQETTLPADCRHCQLSLTTTGSNTIILEPEFPSIWGEMVAQVTVVQVLLTLVLGGLITGAVAEIQELAVELTLVVALLVSFFATLPLLTLQSRNFHPVISGLLFTLVIAPLGWVLLVALNFLAQSVTHGLWGSIW
jgi:hypothetical protein